MKGCELHLSFLSLVCDGFCLFYCKREGWGWKSVSAPNSDFPSQEYCYHYLPRAKLSLMLSKGAEGFPCVSWKGSARRKGQRGWERLLPSKTSPAFRAKPPWGLAIRAGKMWTVAFRAFSFQSCLTVKKHQEWECQAERVCVMPEKGGGGSLLHQRSLWREARGFPQDTSVFQAAVPGGSHPCLTAG